jgi:hypothetical protein
MKSGRHLRLPGATALLALLLALVWSPLPEWILGGWLEAGNEGRPAAGRAHERRDRAEEGLASTDLLGRDAENRRRAAADAVSLPSLSRLLERFGELSLSRRDFLEFYASLSREQRPGIVDPQELLRWTRVETLREVVFTLDAGPGRRARVVFLDERLNRLAERQVELDSLLFGPWGFTLLAEEDSLAAPADPGLVAYPLADWLRLRGGEGVPAGLAELLLLPGVEVDWIYEDGLGGRWLTMHREGRRALLSWNPPAGTAPEEEPVPAEDDGEPDPGRRRWFGF